MRRPAAAVRRAVAALALAAALLAARPARAADDAPAASAPDAAPLTPFRAAEWEVVKGRWIFGPGGELVSAGGVGSAYVLLKGRAPRDFDLEVDVMFTTPGASAGLVGRAAGAPFAAATFYQYEWYADGGRHHDRRLSFMVKNPRWVQLVTPVYEAPALGRWLRLRLRAVGDRFDCWLDGKPVFTKRSRAFLRPGRVGLHVFMPRTVKFGGFRLTELGPASQPRG